MTRIIVHAGFHKTGTSSLQHYLTRHRAALASWFDFYGPEDMPVASEQAKVFSQRPFVWRRSQFRRAFRQFADTLKPSETIVLSNESFCGSMIGHRNWRGRTITSTPRIAIALARVISAELHRTFGPATQVEFLFTTRDREALVQSIYGHLLRSIHLKEDYPTFRAQFADLPEPADEAARIAADLPLCRFHISALEDLSATRAGPASAILRLTNVPDKIVQGLPQAELVNQRQTPETEALFAQLNRSGKSKSELRMAKALLRSGR